MRTVPPLWRGRFSFWSANRRWATQTLSRKVSASEPLLRQTTFAARIPCLASSGIRRRSLSAGALAVAAPWPAAGTTLALLQLLSRPADSAFPGRLLLGIFDPADELVTGQRCDVHPGPESYRVGDQRLAQVCGKPVHRPTGHPLAAHKTKAALEGRARFTDLSIVFGRPNGLVR